MTSWSKNSASTSGPEIKSYWYKSLITVLYMNINTLNKYVIHLSFQITGYIMFIFLNWYLIMIKYKLSILLCFKNSSHRTWHLVTLSQLILTLVGPFNLPSDKTYFGGPLTLQSVGLPTHPLITTLVGPHLLSTDIDVCCPIHPSISQDTW